VSCNPLELRGPRVPPPYSGLPSHDPCRWQEFRAAYDHTHRPLWEAFSEWVAECGLPLLPDLEFIHSGERLNLYVYPAELDYVAARPLGSEWVRLDSCVRRTEGPWSLPPELAQPGPPLVYLSLGSLGGADVDLMRRLVEECSLTPYRFLVSKGPRHQELDLAPNMWGAEMLPQTQVLQKVDAVVTHGGNNTITESIHFGLPMVVLPLFWDQHDNAQRVAEKGFGLRLDAYHFAPGELGQALQRVLGDPALRGRVATVGKGVRRRDGLGRAVRALEDLATDGS
jgi:UDP:flavonoid glycosyltransferase YjiC (YdhE family)